MRWAGQKASAGILSGALKTLNNSTAECKVSLSHDGQAAQNIVNIGSVASSRTAADRIDVEEGIGAGAEASIKLLQYCCITNRQIRTF